MLRKQLDSDAKAVPCGDMGAFCLTVYSYAMIGPWLFRRNTHSPFTMLEPKLTVWE